MKGNQLFVNLNKLYSNIDLAESLANILGGQLIVDTEDEVKINVKVKLLVFLKTSTR